MTAMMMKGGRVETKRRRTRGAGRGETKGSEINVTEAKDQTGSGGCPDRKKREQDFLRRIHRGRRRAERIKPPTGELCGELEPPLMMAFIKSMC